MSQIAHLSPAALQRFETGQQRPHDLAAVVRAYQELPQRPTPTPQRPQPSKQRHTPRTEPTWVHWLVWTVLVALWVMLLVFALTDAEKALDAGSLVISPAAVILALRELGWGIALRGPARYYLFGNALLLTALVIVAIGRLVWEPHITLASLFLIAGLQMRVAVVALDIDPLKLHRLE